MTRRLLMVDDDPSILMALEAGLGGGPWTIETASDAMSAFIKARDLRPFLIITDVQMPSFGKGTDMVRALRKEKATATTPVIVMTGMDLARARALLPADDPHTRLIGKPPDFPKIEALIRELAGVDPQAPA
ncbi:MAG: response regulator [Elusimicrobiota bacterium]|nr:response regulator [Elusimicrobiota bacterium]